MKILHTADWHIGQNFLNKDREEEFILFFDWLIETIQNQQIDLLIVAGDIFDVGYPSNSALQLYYRFLSRLMATCCTNVVITGGNHDSVSTLNAPKEILHFLNIRIVSGVSQNIEDEIIEIRNKHNEIQLVVCAVPFLRDRDIRKAVAGESFEERTKAIKSGITAHYSELALRVQKYKDMNIPLVATGHLLVTGASVSDSEREIYIGNLSNYESENIPQLFDYVALGHIHRPQKIGNSQKIRYSGSPLQLSFSERNDQKQVLLVDFDKNTLKKIEPIFVPSFRQLIKVSGTWSEVERKLLDFKQIGKLKAWGEVQINETNYNPELEYNYRQTIQQLQTIDILKFSFTYEHKTENAEEWFDTTLTLQQLDATEVFEKLLDKQNIENRTEILLSFKTILDDVQTLSDGI